MTRIKVFKKIEKFNEKPPDDADSKEFPDESYKNAYEYQVKLIKAFYKKAKEKAFKEVIAFYKNFITFDDFANYIIYKLEEHTTLDPKLKNKLLKSLEKVYKETQSKMPFSSDLGTPDIKTMQFVDSLNDIYLGKFFKADKTLRVQVLNWMKSYYLENGNPIGKGQTGVEEFLNKFDDFLKVKTDTKARQIIDTTINFVRNAAAVNGYQKAKIKEFVWDAVNDRLTCPACRSMDGRIIKTETAVSQLEEIINKGLTARPIITTPFKGNSNKSPVKFPPLHPLCRCSTYAHFKEEEIQFSAERPQNKSLTPAQQELESEFKNLTNDEIYYKVKAHEGAVWYRPPAKPKNKHIENFLGRKLKSHFLDHGAEVGAKTIEEYKKMAEEIIKNPDEIYVERIVSFPKGKRKEFTTYIFYKGNLKVVSSDDALSINSLYKQTIQDYINEKESNLKKHFGENADWGLLKIY